MKPKCSSFFLDLSVKHITLLRESQKKTKKKTKMDTWISNTITSSQHYLQLFMSSINY